ncbi:hypothetical protein EJB05_49779, partial [Eragrostis curvula]
LSSLVSHSGLEMAPELTVEELRKQQRAEGPATVLAIGTATPTNCVYQADYPDYYFRITKSEHLTDLKEKFKRMCAYPTILLLHSVHGSHGRDMERSYIYKKRLILLFDVRALPSSLSSSTRTAGDKSMIRKRHMYLTEEILAEHPNICAYKAPSLDARQDMVVAEVPKLGAAALKEWGQPRSSITHLVVCTTAGVDMPGADYRVARLLGLRPSVSRLMLYQQGCFAGGTVLRVAKDLAENNRGARVLVVCSEITAVTFRGPSESHLDSLVGQALFADGAAAVIDVPGLIARNIERVLDDAFAPLGVSDWNSIFWAAHPGGPAILDQIESTLRLDGDRLRASRHVLAEYGNMSSACVLFVLDEMRKRAAQDGHATTGEGKDWGVLLGFGPGLTVETVVLRSVPVVS